MNEEQNIDVGLTKAISVIYFLLGVAFTVAVLRGTEVAGTKLEWRSDIWVAVFIILGAFGTLRRTKWGRWMTYIISSVFLFGVPIGTFLGGFMLWHLTKYRAAFNQWY